MEAVPDSPHEHVRIDYGHRRARVADHRSERRRHQMTEGNVHAGLLDRADDLRQAAERPGSALEAAERRRIRDVLGVSSSR